MLKINQLLYLSLISTIFAAPCCTEIQDIEIKDLTHVSDHNVDWLFENDYSMTNSDDYSDNLWNAILGEFEGSGIENVDEYESEGLDVLEEIWNGLKKYF